jgi:hypothetical protein
VEIYVNCSDPDSVRDDLFIELQYILKGEVIWHDLFVENVGTHWVKSFKIPKNSKLGYIHNFRTRVTDMEDNTSPWMYLNNSLKILNNDPRILNIDHPLKMYRGRSISISINATDKENTEKELLIDLEYKMPGEKSWAKSFLTPVTYSTDFWQCGIAIPIDALLGSYSFRARIKDQDEAWTEYQYWNDTLNVTNSMPEVTAFDQTPKEALRTGTVLITASGMDWETSVELLQCQIYYQEPSEGEWKELIVNFDYVNLNWYADLLTTKNFELGNYSFKATFQDDEGGVSNPAYDNHTVWIKNNPPEISLELDGIKVGTEQIKLNLTEYGYDVETPGGVLVWNIDYSTINKNLFRIDGKDIEQHMIIFEPLHNKKGNDDITLILVDADGGYTIKANITVIVDSREEDAAKTPGPEEEDNVVSKLVSSNLSLFIILLIIIIIVTILLFMFHRRRKKRREAKDERREEEELTEEQKALYGDDLAQEAAEILPEPAAPVPVIEAPEESAAIPMSIPAPAPAIEAPQEPAPVPMPASAELPMLTDGTIQQERREAIDERREAPPTAGETKDERREAKESGISEPVEPSEPETTKSIEPGEPVEPTDLIEPFEPKKQKNLEPIERAEPFDNTEK